MVLFRDWRANCSDRRTKGLESCVGYAIQQYESEARSTVALSSAPVLFPDLDDARGREIVLDWLSWGDDEPAVWAAFAEVCRAIRAGVDHAERMIREHSSGMA